jgi:hypothetical protein
MATYLQWQRGKRAARIYWLCGPERVLVSEVEDAIRAQASPPPNGYVPLVAGDCEAPDIWAAATAFPPPGETRLTLIRDAQKLNDTERLADACAAVAAMPGAWLVLTSADADYAARPKGSKVRVRLAGPAVVQEQKCGQVVRCAIVKEDDKAAWVSERVGIPLGRAHELLAACGYDVGAAAAVCAKLAATGLPPTPATFTLLAERPAGEFVDALALCDKTAALRSLPRGENLGFAIGGLASRLDTMALLNSLAEAKSKEVSARAGAWALWLRGASRFYDAERVRERRALLARADSAYRSGARIGVAELLTALW